ncbi:hypothetical protein AB0M02_25380 [Actinoplanes sp. NPDC051861]|uniref:hypothetical protein n=1 Tax=Actinoplanes sp. NPDC051861 TaxID=3155170 RepID=UPI00343E75A3
MNTLEDLRRTLDTHATAAPDAFGLIERARTHAVRLRRRRRILTGTGTALAIVLVSVAVPLFLRQPAPAPSPPAAPPSRSAAQLSVELVPGSAFQITTRGGTEDSQWATVRATVDIESARPGRPGANEGADVIVHDPGTYDPAVLQRGEPVTVAGRPGWYVESLPSVVIVPLDLPAAAGPAVGFQDPSGAWVTVGDVEAEETARQHLIEIGNQVRLAEPIEAGAPFQFGWLPEGLPVSRVRQLPMGPAVTFGFGPVSGRDVALSVTAQSSVGDRDWPMIKDGMPDTVTVNGNTVRYAARPNAVWTGPDTGADMTVEVGTCVFYFHVLDRERLSRPDLLRIVEHARFTSCDDPSTWLPPAR